MLNRGIIKWTDITYKLTASSHVDCDFFKHMFATIEETQQNARTADLDRIELPEYGKLYQCCTWALVNTKTVRYSTSVETVTYSEDLQRSGPVLKRAVDGHPTLYDDVQLLISPIRHC